MIKTWLSAFRLRTLPLSFSCIIMGSGLAYAADQFNLTVFVLALVTTLFLQILSNLANDYGDFVKGTDNEERVGPDRTMQSGLITKNEMMKAFEENDILFIFPHQLNLFEKKSFDISIAIGSLCEMEKKQITNYMKIFENISNFLYFKVWENSGLPYSFYKYYSVKSKSDYAIKDSWKEHFKDRCLLPSNQFELGYEFKD